MFAFDTVIDLVQTGKKEAVRTFVPNDAVAKALEQFVDAQTAYTKAAVKAGSDTASLISAEVTRQVQEVAKVDYSKLMDGFLKVFKK